MGSAGASPAPVGDPPTGTAGTKYDELDGILFTRLPGSSIEWASPGSSGSAPGTAPTSNPKRQRRGLSSVIAEHEGRFHILPENRCPMLRLLRQWTALSALWHKPGEYPARWTGLV